jgi:hypothetical protein
MVNSMPRPLYVRVGSCWYALDGRLDGPPDWSVRSPLAGIEPQFLSSSRIVVTIYRNGGLLACMCLVASMSRENGRISLWLMANGLKERCLHVCEIILHALVHV